MDSLRLDALHSQLGADLLCGGMIKHRCRRCEELHLDQLLDDVKWLSIECRGQCLYAEFDRQAHLIGHWWRIDVGGDFCFLALGFDPAIVVRDVSKAFG